MNMQTRLHKALRPQRGIILITSLIMIIMLTLVVLTSLSVSLASSGVSRNLDGSLAAKAAAQAAIESIITNPAFLDNPTSVSATPVSIDANSDGTADYSVAMAASCVASRTLPASELDTSAHPELKDCVGSGTVQNSGYQTTGASGDSLCAETRWNIQGVATRTNYGDRATVSQGVSVTVPIDDAKSFCS